MNSQIEKQVAEAWIQRFYHRAEVMREIQSGKSESCRRFDLLHTLLVLILGALITFFGFMGTDRLFDAYESIASSSPATTSQASAPSTPPPKADAGKKHFDVAFNTFVLLLFVVSLLNLVFRWKENHEALFAGVKRLTQYLHWLDEVKMRLPDKVDAWVAKEVRLKYQIIVEQLPPNSERDFKKAKLRLLKK